MSLSSPEASLEPTAEETGGVWVFWNSTYYKLITLFFLFVCFSSVALISISIGQLILSSASNRPDSSHIILIIFKAEALICCQQKGFLCCSHLHNNTLLCNPPCILLALRYYKIQCSSGLYSSHFGASTHLLLNAYCMSDAFQYLTLI